MCILLPQWSMQSVDCGLILAPGTDSPGKEAATVSSRLTRSMLTLTDDSTGDFQGNHSGHCLYLTLMIRKLSGDTKSYHTHLDQQTVNSLAEFKKRRGSFLQYSCFHTQAYFVSKAQETASDKKCLHRSQLPKYQGIHDMKWISASCCL